MNSKQIDEQSNYNNDISNINNVSNFILDNLSKDINTFEGQPKKNNKTRNKKSKEKIEYDILNIDNQIRYCFIEEKNKIPEYKKRLKSIICTLNSVEIPYGISDDIKKEIKDYYNNYLKSSLDETENSDKIDKDNKVDNIDRIQIKLSFREFLDMVDQLRRLINRIRNIEYDSLFNYYCFLTDDILKNYKKILDTPVKRSFMGITKNKNENNIDDNKKDLLEKFLAIASKFIEIDISINIEEKEESSHSCTNCKNSTDFEYSEGKITCENCGKETSIISVQTSYKDIDRINMHQRYKYEKISHFKEGVCQFQGKQNKIIDEYLYNKAIEWLNLHGLINHSKKTKCEKFEAVKKSHIRLFISESGDYKITKHYEDLHLIFSELTGRPCADISHLEDSLFYNFEKLVEAFLTLNDTDRINFLNTQFVLRKLLLMENYKINKDDFPGLKTKERQKAHEHLFSMLCSIAGLNNPPD